MGKAHAFQLEAMINVLERKGLLIGNEVLDKLEVIAATKGKEEVNLFAVSQKWTD